jgi:ribosomal protein S12 methylthiotransferase
MELQQGISHRKNLTFIGKELEMLVEGTGEIEDEVGGIEPVSVGRAQRHAPEVDGLVFVPGDFPPGAMMNVRVTDAGPYDLWGQPPSDLAAITTRRGARPRVNRRARPVPMARLTGT